MKIMLDAGHYGKYNPGCEKGYTEAEAMWRLHLLLKSELEKRGISTGTTRADEAKDLALTSRGKLAAGYDLFISLHSNAADSPEPDYPLAVVTLDGRADEAGKALSETAQRILKTVQPARTVTRRSSSGTGEYYGVLRGAAGAGVPGVIIEHSFHTNPASCAKLANGDTLAALAEAEAEALCRVYGIPERAHGNVTLCGVDIPGLREGGRTFLDAGALAEALAKAAES